MSNYGITVSTHAKRRWEKRTPDNYDQDADDAWAVASTLPYHGKDAHEVRYHDETGTLLLRKNEVLATVLRANKADSTTRKAVREVK